MTKTSMNHGELAAGIEDLVRGYVSTIRISAQGAVERGVAASVGGGAGPSAKNRSPSAAPSSRQRARRPSEAIGALSERFYEALCQSPGETIVNERQDS